MDSVHHPAKHENVKCRAVLTFQYVYIACEIELTFGKVITRVSNYIQRYMILLKLRHSAIYDRTYRPIIKIAPPMTE